MDSYQITLFISHSWADPEDYYNLVRLIDSIHDLDWRNVSITKQSPFQSAVMGEPKQRQEIDIQKRALAAHNQEAYKLEAEIRTLEGYVEEGGALASEIKHLEQRIQSAKDSPFSNYMLRLLERDLGMSISEIEESLREKRLRVPSLQERQRESAPKLLQLKSQLRRVRDHENHCELRIEQLRRDAEMGIHLIRYRSQDILYSGGKVSDAAIRGNPNLVLMLREQIRAADAVIVIAEMFAQYRLWMDCELGLAQDLRRPIIAVIPIGQDDCPREVATRAAAVVRWDRVALATGLLPFARTRGFNPPNQDNI